MSLLFGSRERRSFDDPPIPSNGERGRGSFARVDLRKAEASLQKVAVWSATNALATIVSMLPRDVYTGRGEDKQPVATPAWLEDLGGEGHGTSDWLYAGTMSYLLRGNVIADALDRDPLTGSPRLLPLHHPDEINAWRQPDSGVVTWRVRGREVPKSQLWHRRAYPVAGQILGLSPIRQHATTIGLGIAASRFGEQWFTDGGHPSAVMTNENLKKLEPDQADRVKDRFLAAVRGSREPVVLASGWNYQAIQVAPNESQFLETQEYSATECARIYGPGMPEVLGYKTGGSLTYQNREQRILDLLTFTVDPWLVRWELALSSLLPREQYMKFNRSALLRTDVLTRFKVHEIALRNEIKVVNEVRDDEDLSPVEWGAEPRATKTSPPIPVQMEQD